jgi:RND family efflux transporter MFP subunit
MKVRKGDELFRLDADDANSQYAQAKASYDSAKANYDRTKDVTNQQSLLQAQQAYDNAKNTFDDVKRNYDRMSESYLDIQVSKQEMDDALSRLNLAKIQLENAEKNLNLLKQTGLNINEQSATAQLSQAKASLDLASMALQNTSIKSPIDGEVSARTIDKGEMISNATPAYTIINSNILIAEINVPSSVIKKLVLGQKTNIYVGVDGSTIVEGIIDSISPNADPRTQFYNVKVRVDNAQRKLKAGTFSKVVLDYEKKENITVVPNQAIVNTSGVQFLYICVPASNENPNSKKPSLKVKKAPVTVGVSDNKFTEIVKGVKETDEIIVEGQSFLNDDTPVTIYGAK